MKSASTTPNTPPTRSANRLPETPPNDVTGGLDWARDDHAVSVVDAHGRGTVRHDVEHSAAGLRELITVLRETGCDEGAIERPDGPVVDTLLAAGLTIVVISPNQVNNRRGRYGSAGNKDDRFDAYVLADTLRTDRARLRPRVPDSDATVALRRSVRARRDLLAARVAAANQLRAYLRNVLPAAVGSLAELDSPISLAFLTRFDTQDKLDWLSPKRLGDLLAKQSHSGRVDPAVLHARLIAAPRGATGAHASAQAPITAAFVAALTSLIVQIRNLADSIDTQLDAHADSHIFTSLPRAGRVRAARLFAEVGNCRAKFPTPESLSRLASVAPSTRQSGKSTSVGFRWACDKQLRDAVCDFAGDSRHAKPWAQDLHQRARARGHDHPHAVHIIARAWLDVIWHCWHDSVPYDPERHGALQRLLNQDQTVAG